MNAYEFPGCNSLFLLTEKKNSTFFRIFGKLGLISAFQVVLEEILVGILAKPKRERKRMVTSVVVSSIVVVMALFIFLCNF